MLIVLSFLFNEFPHFGKVSPSPCAIITILNQFFSDLLVPIVDVWRMAIENVKKRKKRELCGK